MVKQISLASGIANLSQANKLLGRSNLSQTDAAQCLIHLQSAAETLLRIYLSSNDNVPVKQRWRMRDYREASFPALVHQMAKSASPPWGEVEPLLALNTLRIQAAHPQVGSASVDVATLEGLAKVVDQLYSVYADAIEPNWRRETGMSSSETHWVETRPAAFLRYYPSTVERRLVWIREGTPIEVLPPGQHTPPLWPRVDQVAFVLVVPRRLSLEFQDVLSADRIPLNCSISIEVVVDDDEAVIKRLVFGPTEQERLLRDALAGCVTSEVAGHTYAAILAKQPALAASIAETYVQKLAATESVFRLKGLFLLQVEADDPALTREAWDRAQAAERASTERLALQHRRDLQRETAEFEKERAEIELTLTALKESADQEKALSRAKLERQVRMEEVLATAFVSKSLVTEEGKLAFFPNEVFELKKLEMQQDLEREKYRAEIEKYKGQVQGEAVRRAFELMNQETRSVNGFRAGQANALIAVMAKREQISLSDQPGPSRDGLTPMELSDTSASHELAALRRSGLQASDDGEKISVMLPENDAIEIHRSPGREQPKVWRIRDGQRLGLNVTWWEPGMTITEIVLRLMTENGSHRI